MRCGLEKKPALIFDRKHLLLAMGKPTTSGLQPLSSLSEGSHPSSFPSPSTFRRSPQPRPTSNGQCKQTWSEQTPRDGEKPGESDSLRAFPTNHSFAFCSLCHMGVASDVSRCNKGLNQEVASAE